MREECDVMKEKILELIREKREMIRKLQIEVDLLFLTYASLPKDEEGKGKQELDHGNDGK